jgi:hypothetical protein
MTQEEFAREGDGTDPSGYSGVPGKSTDAHANGVAPPNPYDFDALDEADLTPKEIRGIKWRKRNYVLRQASADAVIKFNNARIKQGRMDDGKLVAINGGGELPAFLVSMCLFEVGVRAADGAEVFKPIPEQLLRATWPHQYIDKLFEDAKRISHIDDDRRTIDQKIRDAEKALKKLYEEKAKEQGPASGLGPDGEALVELDENGKPMRRAVGNGSDERSGDLVGNLSSAMAAHSA